MAEAPQRIEIGFTGGQVISVRLAPEQLRELLERVGREGGWHELETADGSVGLDPRQVVFVKGATGEHRVGFSLE
jgi:hypothetical protein